MSVLPRAILFAVLIAFGLGGSVSAEPCVPFHDGLGALAGITSNGGAVTGILAFTPAVNGNGAVLNGTAHITYFGDLFDSSDGSLSLWFKKTSSDVAGGIIQIGSLGQPNSIGIFYDNQNDLRFEMRNNASSFTAISADGVLAGNEWTHIVAVWRDHGFGCDLLLFVNGSYTDYRYLDGAVNPTAGSLQLGMTGYYGHAEGIVDEVRYFDWCASDDEVYAEYVYSSNRHVRQSTGKPVSTGPVQLVGEQLVVEGRMFKVKGVGYQPIPVGSEVSRAALDSIYTDPAIIARDMALLRAMNVNTIRTWSEVPDATLLDACYNGGVDPIYVIMGYWVPLDGGTDYGDPGTVAGIEGDFVDYVNQFKNHPAVLAWGIGNENNLAYWGDVADWYALANSLAQSAYAAEAPSYHPTVVVNGGMRQFGNVDLGSDDASLNYLDIWGHNAYPGDDFNCYFDYYGMLTAKPLIFTEYGIDAYDNASGGEYQSVQANYVTQQWRQLETACLGATVMAYSDEWWKAGNANDHDMDGYATRMHPDGYSNEEWWGMVSLEDNGSAPDILHPRMVYDALSAEYADVSGDYDSDDDADLHDFAAFQSCFGSLGGGMCGAAFEFVVNGAIDLDDHTHFASCANGPNQTPSCAP